MHSSFRLAVLGLLIISFVGFVTAPSGTGSASTTSIVECNNGNDDDSDGLIDGEDNHPSGESPDPGCTKPYDEDNSEENIYDLDMSWIMAGESGTNGPPRSNGPSIYQNSSVLTTAGNRRPDEIESSTEINETYVEDSSNWAGGSINGVKRGTSDSYTHQEPNGEAEIIDFPNENHCGNAQRDPSGNSETNFNCPQDMGLPDDLKDGAGGTVSKSKKSVTDVFGTYNVNDLSGVSVGDPNNDASKGVYLVESPSDSLKDDVMYKMDLVAPEAKSGDTPYTDDITDSSSSTSDKVVEDEKWQGVPDFHQAGDSTEIHMVYPQEKKEASIGSVTDQNIVQNSHTINDKKGSSVTASGDCTQESGTNGWSCKNDTATQEVCNSTDTEFYQRAEVNVTYDTISVQTKKLETSKADPVSWTDDTTTGRTLEINVTNHDKAWVQESYTQATDCSTYQDNTCGDNCTLTGGASGWKKTSFDYDGKHTSNTIDYYYEQLELKSTKLFDVNPRQDVSSNSLPNSKKALFKNDYSSTSLIKVNSVLDRAYFGYETPDDPEPKTNDPAVSASRFHMQPADGADSWTNNKFISERDKYITYDADGNGYTSDGKGTGDGYISILHRKSGLSGSGTEITGATNEFLDRELKNPYDQSLQQADFVSEGDVPEPDCPTGFVTCIAVADVYLKNINQWGDPTDPSTGIAFSFWDNDEASVQSYSTNESLGSCELWQKLDATDGSDYELESNYDTDTDSPTSNVSRCAGDEVKTSGSSNGSGEVCGNGDDDDGDGTVDEGCPGSNNYDDDPPEPCSSAPYTAPCPPGGDWEAHMEGPAIAHDRVPAGDRQIVTHRYDNCNIKGQQVPQGYVGNVESQETSDGYEENGRSPDWEVCLDIGGTSIIGNPGDFVLSDNYDYDADGSDEELGGEWYDLDNKRVNQYLRSSGSFLIDPSKWGRPNNPRSIAYYWRKNRGESDSKFNPAGGNSGIALEDDCGPGVQCDSERNSYPGWKINSNDLFYNFFLEDSVA